MSLMSKEEGSFTDDELLALQRVGKRMVRALGKKVHDLDPNEKRGFMTLLEVALLLGVSRERVRQIEAKALRLLRHPSRSRTLRELDEDVDCVRIDAQSPVPLSYIIPRTEETCARQAWAEGSRSFNFHRERYARIKADGSYMPKHARGAIS